jgi:LCP family protein required for cell wall assembly
LLLGIDRRPSEPVQGTRSDTMMLVSIDPVAKAVAMVSIPRDLWLNIPGYGSERINVAHALGGPDLAKRTVTADFGVPVQYYLRVDFSGFRDVVDIMGGVIVDVEQPVKDDEYPGDDYSYRRIYIAPGPQMMNGEAALEYARSRHSENDFGRARRQQRVIVAMRDRALQLNMLPRAPQLLSVAQRAVSTDIPATDLLALARLASEIDRSRISNLVIDAQLAEPFKGADGADLLDPDFPGIRRAIDATIKAASHPELRARVEVLNGSGRPGLGQSAADMLTAQGYDVERVALAERADYTTSVLQVLTGNDQAADALAPVVGLSASAIQDAPNASAGVDLRLIVGADFRVRTAPSQP